MKTKAPSSKKRFRSFTHNSEAAVLGMPMELVVSIIIGVAALSIILGYIYSIDPIPERYNVMISPMSAENNTLGPNIFHVNVTKLNGYPVRGATVVFYSSKNLSGLGGSYSNITDQNGYAKIEIDLAFQSGYKEGYLDVVVKPHSSEFELFEKDNWIKIYEH
jgi:hypothetical protein